MGMGIIPLVPASSIYNLFYNIYYILIINIQINKMTITINTQTKTVTLTESVKFLELQEFICEFNLKDYTIVLGNKNESTLADFIRKQKDVSPYTPPYKPSCDHTYRPDQLPRYGEITTGRPALNYPSTTSWEPTGPLKS